MTLLWFCIFHCIFKNAKNCDRKIKFDQGRWQYSRRSSKRWFALHRREAAVTADLPCHSCHHSPACPWPGSSGTSGAGHACRRPWELLGVYGLKASQFTSLWTSQAALRRKSKLTASPPLTKTRSSWGAWSAAGHRVTTHSSPCPLRPPGHADSSAWSLSSHRSSCHPPEEGHTADLFREGREGVLLQLSACRPCKDEQSCCCLLRSCCWSAGCWHLPTDQLKRLQTKGRIKLATLFCYGSEHHS